MESTPFLLSASLDLSITLTKIFEWEQPPRNQTYTILNSQVNRIVVNDDKKFAAATNPYVNIYNPTVREKLNQFTGHTGNVNDVVFSGSNFYTCSEDRTWKFWNPSQGTRPQHSVCTDSPLSSMSLDPTGQYLFTSNEKGYVEVSDVRSYSAVASHRVSTCPVRTIALSHRGDRLIAGCQDGSTHVLDFDGTCLHELHSFRAHDDVQLRCVISPDDSFFVTTSADSTAKIWNFKDFSHQHTLTDATQKKWIWDAAITKDSKYVVTGGTDRTYRTWNAETGEKVFSNGSSHSKGILALAIFEF